MSDNPESLLLFCQEFLTANRGCQVTNREKRKQILQSAWVWFAASIIIPLFMPVLYIGSVPMFFVVGFSMIIRRNSIPNNDEPYTS